MHVHLPKPLHGWREFIGEVGIIVVGVLIALAAEQVVEDISWHAKTVRAERAIKQELQASVWSANERLLTRQCLDRQLDALKDRVIHSSLSRTPAPRFQTSAFSTVYRYPVRPWLQSTWQTAMTEQTVSHMPPEERATLSQAYGTIARLLELNDEEVALSGRLNVLSDALELGPSDRAHWAEVIEEEKVRVGFMAHFSQEIVDAGKSLGVEVDQNSLHDMQSPNTTAAWCKAAHLE